ncbi:MAG: DUF3106 domain-containing protein [Endomicrobiales bacterium]
MSCLLFGVLMLPVVWLPAAGDVPSRSDWNTDAGEGRTPLHENYVKWSHLPKSQKENLKKNYAAYVKLPKDKKVSIRSHYEYWKNLSEQQRQDLRDRLKKWKNMSESERAHLRERGTIKAGSDVKLAGRK